MDIIVKRAAAGDWWEMTDLLGRSMGQIAQASGGGSLTIKPDGGAVETMADLKRGPYASLDVALAEIERCTRGVCRLAPEETRGDGA